MIKNTLSLMFLLCSMLCFTFTAYALSQTESARSTTRVKVDLSGSEDADINNLVLSYITRELRSLGDIDIVDTLPDIVMGIMIGEPKEEDNVKSGSYVMSILLYSPFDMNTIRNVLASEKISPIAMKKLGKMWSFSPLLIWDQGIFFGSKDKLRDTCERIVARFDTVYLSVIRKYKP